MDGKKDLVTEWFVVLSDKIVSAFLAVEADFSDNSPVIKKRKWEREGGGGGESVIISGSVFEKAGVNFSIVHGKLKSDFAAEIPGARESNGEFWASGVSIVAHMCSPFVPAVHMNTRFICTSKSWFGGGIDLTPIYHNYDDTIFFHDALKAMCNKFDVHYYDQFKKNCDEYFYLPHRKEPRGVGGIFYDYMQTGFERDFAFTRAVGECFLEVYPAIVRRSMHKEWSEEERDYQLIRRGRYVEFNLLYDRGTRFGLMTDGNSDAIMMSMPPLAKWV
ncbi:oxygen-dependent coproporphyrinogen oxidase [Anaplasma phagocytophilum]|uniref:oxygen-dependent coproporphyrinogen oxidase n=1 Tax=Anaplasma phagocytophilum TaxID=948 RepID=UPI00201AD0B2